MADGGSTLRSWRERIGAPLRESQDDVPAENPLVAVKDAAYFEARCWSNDCEDLRDPESERWCTAHLAGRPVEVERALAWLADLGYAV